MRRSSIAACRTVRDLSEVRELKSLRDENGKLRQLVAELTLDKQILREALGKKMVSPTHRRAAVRWAQDAFGVSERRACRVLHVSRRLVWYRSVRPDDAPIRRRLHELARTRGVRLAAAAHLAPAGWPNRELQESGDWIGYHAAYARYPEQHTSVIVLCTPTASRPRAWTIASPTSCWRRRSPRPSLTRRRPYAP